VISTWRENAVMVWSWTGRSSLRGYGLDESGNGAWLRWIFGSAASVIQQSYGEQRRRRKGEMERRLGEQARGGFKARLRRQSAHARGQRAQASGDGGRTRGFKFLNRSAMVTLTVI